jgi:hypothetical protein
MMNLSASWKSGLLAAVLSLSSLQASAATDELSTMFQWWNSAFKTQDGFNAEAFARYYTPDARLVIDGVEQARGIGAWVQHFRKIQASGAQVEIVLPFRQVFKQGDKIYTYHVIRSVRNGKAGCTLAAGHAFVVKGKISEVNLVRAVLPPEQAAKDPSCAKS